MSLLKNFIQERFNLHDDKADEAKIIQTVRRDVQFKGANLWALVFAILIASIGLNVNSTAVVIGAMLISPLMGPIMGIGLSIGINDFELLQRGVKNLVIATIISVLTSMTYFLVTPLHDTNSELLARTNPSLWDVFIAFFGGLAGIVAITRKERNHVIAGVAIATALMPPLCTAGYGLANGKWYYFLGALYLYFINSLMICFATLLIVKHLKFHKKEFASKENEKRVIRSMSMIVIITIAPSIYLAYRIVERSIFESNAKTYVQNEFNFHRTQVINKNFKMEGHKKIIELLLVGNELEPKKIDSLKQRMPLYSLDSTQLVIHQGLDAKQEIDLAQIKASILEDVFKEEEEKDTLPEKVNKLDIKVPDLRSEIKALYPDMQQFSLAPVIVHSVDTTNRQDTIVLFTARNRRRLSNAETQKLTAWLKQRIQADSVKTVIVTSY